MMATFTLDTSGAVVITTRRDLLANGVPAEPDERAVRWPDLSPFVQGYVEALFASLGPYDWKDEYGGAWPSKFSDLDPSALALILRDCEARLNERSGFNAEHENGVNFWRNRQAHRPHNRWRPLQPYLSDEGRVCLREVAP